MKKKLKILAIILLTFVGFYFLTDRLPRTSAPVRMNCSDVGGFYEPCTRDHKIYGIPFAYATGYTYIPGDGDKYYKGDVKPLIFIADYVIVSGAVYGLVRVVRSKQNAKR